MGVGTVSDRVGWVDIRRRGVAGSVERAAAAAAVGAATLPLLAAIIRSWGGTTTLTGDFAVIGLRVRDVLGPDNPLVGVYSHFGWNHPGPVIYWMMAPFSWLLGDSGWSLSVGTAAIQLAAVIAICSIAWRHGGSRWVVLWAAVITLSYSATGPWMLLEVWNPHLAFPIFILLLCICWRCLVDPGSFLVWIVVVGSILVQLHVGYGVLVISLLLAVAVRLIASVRTGHRPANLRCSAILASAAALMLWAPPLVDAITNRGGNARLLIEHFLLGQGAAERVEPTTALGVAADTFRIPPQWAGGLPDIDRFTGSAISSSYLWLGVPIVLVVIGALCFRSMTRSVRMLLVVSWVGTAAGFLSLLLVTGGLAPYLFYWRVPLSILLFAATAAALAQAASRRVPRLAGILIPAVAVLLLVPSVQLARDVLTQQPNAVELSVSLLADSVESEPTRSVMIRYAGKQFSGLQPGLLNELELRGVQVRVDPGTAFQFGRHREASETSVDRLLYASELGYVIAYLDSLPGSSVVDLVTPLTDGEERELQSLQLAAIDELVSAGELSVVDKLDSPLVVLDLDRLDVLEPPQRQRLAELNQRVVTESTCRCGIVEFKPGEVPTELRGGWLQTGSGARPAP